MEPQDHLEDLVAMVCLACQVRKETWVPLDLQDLLEDREPQEDLVLLDLKVNQDFQVETVHQVVLVLKERGETWASRDRQDPVFHRGP